MSWSSRRTLISALLAICPAFAALPALAAGEILVGNVASMTNPTARENSRNLVLGYNVYFEHVNSAGGLRGRKIKLVNKDDGVKAEAMVELAKELIADKEILALVGFLNTAGLADLIKEGLLPKSGIAMIAQVGAQGAPNFYPLRAGYNDEARKILQEIKESQRKRVAFVYFNQAFGPSIFKFATDTAPKLGINVVATSVFETTPEKLDAGIEAAAAETAKAKPDAVFLMAAGFGAYKFVKRFREVYPDFVQVYALSPADYFGFVKVAGLQSAQGVIISQCVPYPKNTTLAIVREYQKMMKQYAPKEQLSFYGLEGFMGGKIAVEAIRRAGPNPTREKIIAALNTMKDFDLGDFTVSYSPEERSGSNIVDLTIIGRNGELFR